MGMSVVAQTTCLFSTTIRENIVYGLPQKVRENITDQEIEDALKQSNAWSFVNDFPRKLETYAGERGVKLSGGQKQRLAIARAIIRKPTIIFLDEATSALDSKAEVIVQEALDKMIDQQSNGCTLIIAHRLSTLRTCDRILVMDKGCLKESGSHAELMKIEVRKDSKGNMLSGWYRDLYETQHGKEASECDVEKLQAKLKSMQQEMAKLKECNTLLKKDVFAGLKLEKHENITDAVPAQTHHLPHLLPPLCLARQSSDPSTSFFKARNETAPPPPPQLSLERCKTTP